MQRSGGRILIDQLLLNRVDLAFGVPGESYLHALDAMHGENALKFVICRQEGGAAMMAEAYGKLTGRPASPSSPVDRAPPTPPPACTSHARTARR